MSTEVQSGTVEQDIQKTVQIVAYLDEEHGETVREVANRWKPSEPWFETEEKEYHSYYIERDGEKKEIDEETYQLLLGSVSEEVSLTSDTRVEEVDKMGSTEFPDMVASDIFDELPESIFGNVNKRSRWSKYKDSNRNTIINFYSRADEMGLLKHPEEITPTDMFEDERERPVIKWKVRLRELTENQMETATEEVVEPFVGEVASKPFVERVRWYDCKRKTTEKGACLNI